MVEPGLELDTHPTEPCLTESMMKSRISEPPYRPANASRNSERVAIALPARLMWKDQRGATRFASVMTRNVSEFGAYVECASPLPLSLYKLVQFQLERDVNSADALPPSLKHGRIFAAVYRVKGPDARGRGQGLALRLMVEPTRTTLPAAVAGPAASVRASA
jgi:hypothetical protein